MFPDFLGIGAQKSGTTWLHHNLSRHPEVWLPPVKELHYLDREPPSLFRRLTKKTETLRKARSHFRMTLVSLGRKSDLGDLGWAARYLFAPRNDAWYASLFPELPGRITGEICPGYAGIEPRRIAHIHSLMPQAKILYLLRNPMDRAWSTTVMHFNKPNFHGLAAADRDAIRNHLVAGKTRKHGDYLENLRSWRAHYPSDEVFVGYFDQLEEDPRGLLKDILAFLGVGCDEAVLSSGVAKHQNKGKGDPIPGEFRELLAELHYSEIAALNVAMPNPYTQRWLEGALAARGPGSA